MEDMDCQSNIAQLPTQLELTSSSPTDTLIFNRVPDEITIKIFKAILGHNDTCKADLCTAACFGLACMKHWSILKNLHPQPIYLCWSTRPLDTLLQTWMTTKYRLPTAATRRRNHYHQSIRSVPYLSCLKYGSSEEPNLEEEEFRASAYRLQCEKTKFYPNPFGMDQEAWYLVTANKFKELFSFVNTSSSTFRTRDVIQRGRRIILQAGTNGTTAPGFAATWNAYEDSVLRKWVHNREEAVKYRKEVVDIHSMEFDTVSRVVLLPRIQHPMVHEIEMLRMVPDIS